VEAQKVNQREHIEKLLVGLLIAATAVVSFACSVAAQPRLPMVGVLTPGLSFKPVLEGLREGLEKLGYKEGDNIRFMVEDSQGDLPGLASRAAKLVEAKPDVLFTVVTAPTLAAKQATHTIPIVFAGVVDPIQSGLVASFASSRNNLTGVSAYTAYLSGKRLEILKAIAPRTQKILAVVSAKENVAQISFEQLKKASSKMGVNIFRRDVASTEDIEKLLLDRWAGKVDAIFHLPSVFVEKYFERLVAKSNKERLPLIVHDETLLRMGALASYGGDFRSYGAQAAKLAAKILKGARPSDIPIEVPDRFILAVNLTTAKKIGLKIPRMVLEGADRLVD
jgi:putative ABC transport system substrate-binding protein